MNSTNRLRRLRERTICAAVGVFGLLVTFSWIASAPAHAQEFVRGDANVDSNWDISDPILTLLYLFSEAVEPRCLDAADVNDDGRIDVSDAIYSLSGLFADGPPPGAPHASCGLDPTSDSLCCSEYPHCAAGGPNDPPVAAIEASPVSGLAPLLVNLDASGSTDDSGLIASYEWDFGSGDTDFGSVVAYTFKVPGTYDVVLAVIDCSGSRGEASVRITVLEDGPPVASFSFDPNQGAAPQQVTFDASESFSLRGTLVSYEWDFGDGDFGAGIVAGHTFNTGGTYTVRLTVEDDVGDDASASAEVVVADGTTTVVRTSPASGESGVAVTRETVVEFSGPLVAGSVSDESLFASFGEDKLAARLHLSSESKTVTLYYEEPLPPSAVVRVTIDGDLLQAEPGVAIDADADGIAGGKLVLEFQTLNLTSFPGTAVCGRVFASELVATPEGAGSMNEPLQGVLITVDGLEDEIFAETDSFGNFRLENAPAGRFFVHIDGRTAVGGPGVPEGAYYPFVGKAWASIPDEEINIGEIYLPLILPGTLQAVSADVETVITFPDEVLDEFPELGGVSIRVPANSLFADDGTRGGSVGIAPVAPDRLPGTLPQGLNFPLVITVQTDGATNFDEPVPVCFPNLPDPSTGITLSPGAKSSLWSFNHDTGRFEVVGPMTVSADGTLICSDPGVGIRAPGWHGAAPGNPLDGGSPGPGGGDDPPGPNEPQGNGTDPIYLFSGELAVSYVDLEIAGRGMDFVWKRKYRSKAGLDTRQGNGWDFLYNIRIVGGLTRGGVRTVQICTGDARADTYFRRPDGTYGRTEFFRVLTEENDGTYKLAFADGKVWEFHSRDGSPRDGRIVRIVDRNGNALRFVYDSGGLLVRVIDTLDRSIDIGYDSNGFISTLSDFSGRVVRYEYYRDGDAGGSAGDLKSMTKPTVTGTPNGNDFPQGKTTTFTYSKDTGHPLRDHNLLTITDPRRNDPNDPTFGQGPFVQNIYSTTRLSGRFGDFDRIVRQIWGDSGDIIDLSYIEYLPTAANGYLSIQTIVNDRNGHVREYFYDIGNRLVRERNFTGRAIADMRTTEDSNRPTNKLRAQDPDFFETRYEWNDDSLIKRVIYPNGNFAEYTYESDLDPAASPRRRGNLRIYRLFPGTHVPGGDQPLIEERYEHHPDFGGGHQFVTRHVDGRGNETVHQYDDRGNRIHTTHRIASTVDDFEYNEFGQLTARIFPDNGSDHRRRDEFTYYSSGLSRGFQSAMIVDAGNLALTTSFEYDRRGNVIRRIDPMGRDSRFVVNERNLVVRAISREISDGSELRFERDFFYNANDSLARLAIKNIDGEGALQKNTHITVDYEYDILNYPTRTTEEVDSGHAIVTQYEYDRNRNRTLVRHGEAVNGAQPTNTLRVIYDERNLPFRSIRGEGDASRSTDQFDYDRNGNLAAIHKGIESLPRLWTSEYDGYNRLVRTMDPQGNITILSYDANGNRVGTLVEGEIHDGVGADGNVRLYEKIDIFDELDRRVATDAAFFDTETQAAVLDGSSVTMVEYSANSQILRLINDNDHASTYSYDTANRTDTVTDAKGNFSVYSYDDNSNVVQLTETDRSDLGNPDQSFSTIYEYDGIERRIRSVDNVGNTSRASYDSRHNRTVFIDALGNRTQYVFDGINRLVATSRILTDDGAGTGKATGSITTLMAWDDSSRLISRTDDNGNATAYVYDALNRRTATNYADGSSHFVSYDVHDNVLTSAQPNQSVVTSAYDLLDRLIGRVIARGPGVSSDSTSEIYGYDGLSRVNYAEDDDSLVTRSYDSLSRLTSETLNGQTTTSLYDGVGNMLSCVYPGGRVVTCTFDEREFKASVSDQSGLIAGYDYVGNGRVERRDYGNGTRCEMIYDGISGVANPVGDFGVKRIMAATHSRISDAEVLDERSFTWDRASNKAQRVDVRAGGPELSHEYAYDSAYRLVRSVESSATEVIGIDYEFDGVGNRISVTGGPSAGVYTLDDSLPQPADFQANQYTGTPVDSREYDRNGSLVNINGVPGESFVYDYRDQMVEHESAGVVSSYEYDALGRRIARTVGGSAVTRYFYTGFRVCEEQDGGGSTTASYVYGNFIDEVLTVRRDGQDYYYHADDLFNIVALSDATGTVVERYEYDDFGAPRVLDGAGDAMPGSAFGNPYFFNGRRYDLETGFYWYRTRYLDPSIGRFASRDVIGIWGDPGNHGNGLTYVANNPWSNLDPYGLTTASLQAALNSHNTHQQSTVLRLHAQGAAASQRLPSIDGTPDSEFLADSDLIGQILADVASRVDPSNFGERIDLQIQSQLTDSEGRFLTDLGSDPSRMAALYDLVGSVSGLLSGKGDGPGLGSESGAKRRDRRRSKRRPKSGPAPGVKP